METRRKLVAGTGKKERLEENAKTIIADSAKLRSQLTFKNMLPQFILYLTMMAIYWWISSVFDGQVVAILPFEPMSFFRGVTHRGIEGDNFYHCAVVSARG
jgi:Na+/glutamate symporter